MKTLITATLMTAALSFNLAAQESNADSIGQICGSYAELAGNVMRARQNNTPIITVYKIADGNKIAIAIIKDAYAQPLFSTDDYKNNIIVSFSNDVFLNCINTFGDEV